MLRAVITGLVLAGSLVAPAHASEHGCRDATVPLTVEEQRLTVTLGANPEPVARQIMRSAGLSEAGFERTLCTAVSLHGIPRMVDEIGRWLWERGSRLEDDRPLYWTRLAMTAALRQWKPDFAVPANVRKELEKRLEYASRGITSNSFLPIPGAKRLFVTGFDPFQLDSEIRRANPSGAAVLRLDGRVFHVDGRLVQIQTAVFPVRYADFDQGMVEDALRATRPDMVVTISQGRPAQFDLEVFNGRRRSVSSIGDNNNIWGGGSSTAPVVFPGVGPGEEFNRTTLPVDVMKLAAGRFPIKVNTVVVEIPAGGSGPVVSPNGPTPGSIAVQGAGGGYLSNEIAYRAVALLNKGGHLHTPILLFGSDNTTDITDPVFEQNRADITAQVEAALRAGASVRMAE